MTAPDAPPYPEDTRAKGWKFYLDTERVRQSDTWALAPYQVRPWLLMLWMTAWEQAPCGSLPAKDSLISARLDCDHKAFMKMREHLMRGWWLASDGRLYHPVITEQVISMLKSKNAERDRKAEYRKKMEAERARLAEAVPDLSASVPELSRGTDTGRTPDSTGRDATGTGTGTGTMNTGIATTTLSRAGASAEGESDAERAQNVAAFQPTAAGAICRALKAAGIWDVNPGHPRLKGLIDSGATADEFVGFASSALEKGAGFLWIVGAVEGERKRAAKASSSLHKGRLQAAQGVTTETAYARSMRLKYEAICPSIAAKAPGAENNVIDMGVVDVAPKLG